MAQLDSNPFSALMGSSGLSELDVKVPNAGTYLVSVRLTVPSIKGLSQVVTVVKVNSTTKYTSNPGDRGLQIRVGCAANDTIKVITSSSTPIDNVLNAVRITVSIAEES